jgi:UDP:flavonoid glycosyltransferase YjiC (YdhE family)
VRLGEWGPDADHRPVPLLFDQFYWGKRLAALGVGPRPIPFKRLSAERLASAIATAITDREMRRRAADLGERVRAEGGVRTAVDVIERLLDPSE